MALFKNAGKEPLTCFPIPFSMHRSQNWVQPDPKLGFSLIESHTCIEDMPLVRSLGLNQV